MKLNACKLIIRMDYSLMNRKALVSLCRERGIRHSRHTKENLIRWLQNPGSQPRLDTEGTGKMFEMAICLANDTPFVSPKGYKYNLEKAEQLRPRLAKLFESNKYIHTAEKQGRYDFTCIEPLCHLSAKSNKDKDNGVAVQGIGQRNPKDFCDSLGIPYTTLSDLKQYIQSNIVSILPVLVMHTFDCPLLYYNERADTIRHITLTTPFEWEKYEYTWSRPWDNWSNSSTLYIEKEGLLEIQFHSKSRTNMAVRWRFEKMLNNFKSHFSIIDV